MGGADAEAVRTSFAIAPFVSVRSGGGTLLGIGSSAEVGQLPMCSRVIHPEVWSWFCFFFQRDK